jgi:hypothetical protein
VLSRVACGDISVFGESSSCCLHFALGDEQVNCGWSEFVKALRNSDVVDLFALAKPLQGFA